MDSQLMKWEMGNGLAADRMGNRLTANGTGNGKWQYFMVLQSFEWETYEVILSQTTNWVWLKFFRQVYNSPMHPHTKH